MDRTTKMQKVAKDRIVFWNKNQHSHQTPSRCTARRWHGLGGCPGSAVQRWCRCRPDPSLVSAGKRTKAGLKTTPRGWRLNMENNVRHSQQAVCWAWCWKCEHGWYSWCTFHFIHAVYKLILHYSKSQSANSLLAVHDDLCTHTEQQWSLKFSCVFHYSEMEQTLK